MSHSPPILVTGATGTVGAPLVDMLLDAGSAVRAASRNPDAAERREGLESVRFDLTDPGTWSAAFTGVRTMFLLRPPQVANIGRDIAPAMRTARAVGVRHVVLLSVQGADRLAVVPHARIEAWLRGSGMSWTFVRPSFFTQNLAQVHGRQVRDHDELLMPAGQGRTAFVDAQDVAAVAAAALLHPDSHTKRAYTPTGPEALTYTAVTCLIYTTARLGIAAGLTDDVRTVTGHEPTAVRPVLERERQEFIPQSLPKETP